MMKSLIACFLIIFCAAQSGFSQAVFTTTGSWDLPMNWLALNIGDDISEDVTINASRVALIDNGFSYTTGNLNFGNSAGLTINTTGSLDVGASGNPKNLTANNNAALTVSGTLIIWGDLIVNNSLSLNVSGTLIIKGNIIMNNLASLSVTGSIQVDQNFAGGDNTNVTISGGGGIDVAGNVTVGIDSNLTGPPGSFTAGGCAQGVNSNFCNGGVLPVDLLFFTARATLSNVKINWATASEINSDYFVIEKSDDGLEYRTLAKVNAQGNSVSRVEYEIFDEKPTIGKAYYRLKEVDLDGKQAVYEVVLVEFTGLRITSVYPNPVSNGQDINLELNFTPKYPLEVSLFDLSGKSLERLQMNNSSASMPIRLSPGMYVVKVSSLEYSSVSKFLVR
jgi:hypothetical protein